MQQIPQANQEPLLNKAKYTDNDRPKRGGLSRERIAIIVLSIIVVALLLVIVFLLFAQTSSTSSNNDDNIVPITIPARKINSQVTKASKKALVTKTTKSTTTTTTYNPFPDYGAGSEDNTNNEVNVVETSAEEDQEKEVEDFIEEDYEENSTEFIDEDVESGDSDLMDRLSGTWDLISSENFDQVMEKLGVSWFKRRLAANLKPTVIISKKSNDQFSIKTVSSLKTSEIVFSLDEPFKEVTLDDKDAMTTITLEGDRLVQTQRDFSTNTKVTCIILRELDENDQMVTYVQAGNIVSKRVYKRS